MNTTIFTVAVLGTDSAIVMNMIIMIILFWLMQLSLKFVCWNIYKPGNNYQSDLHSVFTKNYVIEYTL